MKTDQEYDAVVQDLSAVRATLNNISDYAVFTMHMFDCVVNPERLREALDNIARDAKEAAK